MNTPRLQALAQAVARVPCVPDVLLALLDLGERYDASDAIIRIVSRDQALVALILRVANSAFYRMSGRIGSLEAATRVLGTRNTRDLAIAAASRALIPLPAGTCFEADAFWRHSCATAVCAREISATVGQDPELAFTAGLLHDFGRLVMVAGFPEQFDQLLKAQETAQGDRLDAEQLVFGFDHGTAGGALAELWRLPPPIAAAMANHHLGDSHAPDPLADLVHLADALAHALDFGAGPHDHVPPLSDAACARLRVDWSAIRASLGTLERLSREMMLNLIE